MKRRAPAICILALWLPLCAAGNGFASPASDAIRAAYTRLDAAYGRRDVPGIAALYAPGFARHGFGGMEDLAQNRRALKDSFDGTKTVKAATSIKSLTVRRGRAEAIVARRVDFTLPAPLPDLPPPYFTVDVSEEHWLKTPSGWRLTLMRETPLQPVLWRLSVRDQTIRRRIIADPENPALLARMKAIDDADRAEMKRIIQKYGWPGFDLVGTQGAEIAGGIIQHSDDDRTFQKRCLPLLRAAVRRGQAMPSSLALLTDRLLRASGKPQVYGTQLVTDGRGNFVPPPLRDPARVDQRRASVGLGPLAEYLKRSQQLYHPTSEPATPKAAP